MGRLGDNDGDELQLALRPHWLVRGILLCGGRATVGEEGPRMFQENCLPWVGPASGYWLRLCYSHSSPRPPEVLLAQCPVAC